VKFAEKVMNEKDELMDGVMIEDAIDVQTGPLTPGQSREGDGEAQERDFSFEKDAELLGMPGMVKTLDKIVAPCEASPGQGLGGVQPARVSADSIQKDLVVKFSSTPTAVKVLRRSKRGEAAADINSLDKAKQLVARRNLKIPMEGNKYKNSILTIPDNRVSSNLHNIGISLGSSVDDIQVSVNSFMNTELDRFSIYANNNFFSKIVGDPLNDVVSDDELDHLTLNHICGDLIEDGDTNSHLCITDVVPRKKKSSSSKKRKINNSRSCKNRIKSVR